SRTTSSRTIKTCRAASVTGVVASRLEIHLPEDMIFLASDVQDGVGVRRIVLEKLNGFRSGTHVQDHAPLLCFHLDLIHHREAPEHPGADDKMFALPRDCFQERHRRVPESLLELARRFFPTSSEFSSIQDHILGVFFAVDLDGANLALAPFHRQSSW